MTTVQQLKDILFDIAPADLAEEWDNVGIMVDSGKDADKILFALDCTDEVLNEAKKRECGIVVTHHPFIFRGVKSISAGSALYKAIHEDISVLSVHTNYDSAENGVNDVLCERLDIDVAVSSGLMGRIGYIKSGPMDFRVFCEFVKERLNITSLDAAYAGSEVHKVMVIGGSGGDFLNAAREYGCDTLVTGEASHHDGIDALSMGINLVVAGHYATENPSIPNLRRMVQERLGDKADCFISLSNRDPFLHL